jgi:hypothetical protein
MKRAHIHVSRSQPVWMPALAQAQALLIDRVLLFPRSKQYFQRDLRTGNSASSVIAFRYFRVVRANNIDSSVTPE